ncbi:uncharacterized protein G2W53_001216 [Senna tora]|uniref:Uncharacterized protein n=1 Tax=Senna tora TaxID=362788 RepID=A0A834XI61_9FABA|nr:uncharacterized protein G2W53_001216 [Senna tora]
MEKDRTHFAAPASGWLSKIENHDDR